MSAGKSEKLTLYSWFAVLTVSLGGFLFSYCAAIISGALPVMQRAFALQPFQEGMVVSFLLLGACVGSLGGGVIADRLGRRKMLMITALIFTIGFAIIACSQNLGSILFGRLFTGFALGFVSLVSPLYLAEISPPHLRGALVSINSLVGTIGILTAYIVNYLFLESGNWQGMFATGMIPSLFLFMAMFFLPETPEWLFAHGSEENAIHVLRKLRGDRGWESHLAEMKRCASPHKDASWHRLFQPAVKFALFVGITLSILQQITGINAVIYFAPKIFREAGFGSDATSFIATISVGAINVVATFVSLKLMDRAGRRPLLMISTIGMMVSLITLSASLFFGSVHAGPIAVITLMSYVACFALGMGPIPWLILAEIYPLSIRGRAMSLATAANWISNFIIAITFLDLIRLMGSKGVFLLFGAISLVAFVFVRRFVPETKGKTLEEIEISLASMKKR